MQCATLPSIITAFIDRFTHHCHHGDQTRAMTNLVPKSEAVDAPLTALAILPSGPVPWRDRVVAIAALRFQHRRILARFETLLRPRRRVPEYAQRVLAAAEGDWDAAPDFLDVEAGLRDFLGQTTLVGYGIRVTTEFLAAELARVNRPGLSNREVELAELALSHGFGAGKPSLAGLAAELGLAHPRPGNPAADARAAARIAALLLERPPADAAPGAALLPERWALLDPARLRGTAETPGVYIFRDAGGRALYAGAASNLRRRLATYQSRPLTLERRLEGLAQRVWDIETRQTSGYLEALIEEARVIAQHTPPFNTQRRQHASRRFIRAQAEPPRPGARLVAEVAADGAIYVGPFASARRAQQALTLARAIFPALRRQGKGSVSRGKRPVGRAAQVEAERSETVRRAVRFFSGQRDEALAALSQRQAAAHQSGDLGEANHLRDLARQVRQFELVPSPLIDGATARFAVIMTGAREGVSTVYHIGAGHILDRLELTDGAAIEAALARWREARSTVEPDLESWPLIMRWLALLGPRCRIVCLPAIPPASG